MKRIGSERPKSTRLHNEMDVRERKTTMTCGCANNRITISDLVRIEIKFNERCKVTNIFCFVRQFACHVCSFFV